MEIHTFIQDLHGPRGAIFQKCLSIFKGPMKGDLWFLIFIYSKETATMCHHDTVSPWVRVKDYGMGLGVSRQSSVTNCRGIILRLFASRTKVSVQEAYSLMSCVCALAKLLCTEVDESFNNSGLQSISFLLLKKPIYNT